MNKNTPLSKPDFKPGFVRKQLEEAALLPGESREELLALYHEFECSDDSAPATAAEHMMLLQVVMLVINIQRLERNRRNIILHHRPAAVAALLRRTSEYGYVDAGSVAEGIERKQIIEYFTSEGLKNKLEKQFNAAGYGPDAVDVEAYNQASAACAKIDQQIANARRQLMAFLKELDRRYARRAAEIRNVAMTAVERAKFSAGSGVRS
jgi:hypothetical protein